MKKKPAIAVAVPCRRQPHRRTAANTCFPKLRGFNLHQARTDVLLINYGQGKAAAFPQE